MKNRKKYKVKNRFPIYLMVVSLLTWASCSTKKGAPRADKLVAEIPIEEVYELTINQYKSSDMECGKLEMKTFHEVVKANGMFDVPPESLAAVSCYIGGSVKDIHLLPGQRVKKGEVLFILENPEYVQLQQDYLEAQGQLVYLKSDYERQKNLAQDNVTSQKTYLKAESDYTVTRVKVESLSKKLTLLNINPNTVTIETIHTTVNVLSPISGYVTQVAISRGAFLKPSEMAITIVNTDHLHLELNIFEKDFAKVRVGQPIQFRIQEDISNTYNASVQLVNKTVDYEKRTIGIHGHLADIKLVNKFNPGMYVEADIFISSESKMSLPPGAVIEADGKYYVLVLLSSSNIGYSFAKKEVKTGSSGDGSIEILNTKDFKENTEFLIKGSFNLITE